MKTFKKTISVQIEVAQNSEFKSEVALHQWIAHCLNCNTNNREVTVTVDGVNYGPEVRATVYLDDFAYYSDESSVGKGVPVIASEHV